MQSLRVPRICHGGMPKAFTSGHRVQSARHLRPGVPSAAPSRANWRSEVENPSGGEVSAATPSPSPNTQPTATTATAPPTTTATATAPPPPARPADPAAPTSGPSSLPTFDMTELLSQPGAQSSAFAGLSAFTAILVVLCGVEPEAVLDLALPNAYISDLDVTFVRVLGVTLAASATVDFSLKHAAEAKLLSSATYQRLMAGHALKGAAFLLVLLSYLPATFGSWNPLMWLVAAGAAGATTGINLTVMSHTSSEGGFTAPSLDLKAPQNATSWGYTLCGGLYLLTAAACFAPETLFTGDPYSSVTPLVKAMWAPGFMLAAIIAYVLKDASDRDRLGASTFKNLNLGLAALEYGYSVIFGSAILSDEVQLSAPALSNLVGSLLIATFALYTYATAKK